MGIIHGSRIDINEMPIDFHIGNALELLRQMAHGKVLTPEDGHPIAMGENGEVGFLLLKISENGHVRQFITGCEDFGFHTLVAMSKRGEFGPIIPDKKGPGG